LSEWFFIRLSLFSLVSTVLEVIEAVRACHISRSHCDHLSICDFHLNTICVSKATFINIFRASQGVSGKFLRGKAEPLNTGLKESFELFLAAERGCLFLGED